MDKTLDNIIKNHIVLTVLSAVTVVCMMVTITYGLYQTNHKNTVDQEIAIGEFDVNLTSNSGQITLTDLNPGDEPSTVYTFTTSNSGDYVVNYNVYFTDNTTTFLENSTNATTYAGYTQVTSDNYAYINYSLDGQDARSLSEIYDSATGKMMILNGRLEASDSFNHTVTFSVASNAPNNLQGSILALNITMDASASKEAGVDTVLKLAGGASNSSTDVITKNAPSGSTCTNTLAYDGTRDYNLRYVGADPCNYVTFNDEVAGWRIIGVMNNVDDGIGKKETRLKLVRKESLGEYSWDTSDSSVNSGNGVNDWTQADLMRELNGDYLDTTLPANTMWYNGANNQKTGEFDYTKGLSTKAQKLIENAKWYLGGHNLTSDIAKNFYVYERGNIVWGNEENQICNDGVCPRATEWTGKVALIYPSDYGFAIGGTERQICLNTSENSYASINCHSNDWINHTVSYYTIMSDINYPKSIFYISNNGNLYYYNYSSNSINIYPTLYLKSNIKITSGDGSPENPYELG